MGYSAIGSSFWVDLGGAVGIKSAAPGRVNQGLSCRHIPDIRGGGGVPAVVHTAQAALLDCQKCRRGNCTRAGALCKRPASSQAASWPAAVHQGVAAEWRRGYR